MRWAIALAAVVSAGPVSADLLLPPDTRPAIVAAELVAPTRRYDHAVLGDGVEWGGLRLAIDDCPLCGRIPLKRFVTITLPESRVFEDVEARLADLDGDRLREVIVVETDIAKGASLAIYGTEGKIAATPFLGRTHRWLAPAGIADFDGDGRTEIAYVDRPHLLAELVFVRLQGDRLVEIARLPGLTNHRIGDSFISGGVRDCGQGPELILASKDWTRLVRVRAMQAQDIGPMPEGGLETLPRCPA